MWSPSPSFFLVGLWGIIGQRDYKTWEIIGLWNSDSGLSMQSIHNINKESKEATISFVSNFSFTWDSKCLTLRLRHCWRLHTCTLEVPRHFLLLPLPHFSCNLMILRFLILLFVPSFETLDINFINFIYLFLLVSCALAPCSYCTGPIYLKDDEMKKNNFSQFNLKNTSYPENRLILTCWSTPGLRW